MKRLFLLLLATVLLCNFAVDALASIHQKGDLTFSINQQKKEMLVLKPIKIITFNERGESTQSYELIERIALSDKLLAVKPSDQCLIEAFSKGNCEFETESDQQIFTFSGWFVKEIRKVAPVKVAYVQGGFAVEQGEWRMGKPFSSSQTVFLIPFAYLLGILCISLYNWSLLNESNNEKTLTSIKKAGLDKVGVFLFCLLPIVYRLIEVLTNAETLGSGYLLLIAIAESIVMGVIALKKSVKAKDLEEIVPGFIFLFLIAFLFNMSVLLIWEDSLQVKISYITWTVLVSVTAFILFLWSDKTIRKNLIKKEAKRIKNEKVKVEATA